MRSFFLMMSVVTFISCKTATEKGIVLTKATKEFVWQGANIYFLLTDRFKNADPSNDIQFNRKDDAAKLRGFNGGDFKGITENCLYKTRMELSSAKPVDRGLVNKWVIS